MATEMWALQDRALRTRRPTLSQLSRRRRWTTTKIAARSLLFLLAMLSYACSSSIAVVQAFAAAGGGSGHGKKSGDGGAGAGSGSLTLFDRFRPQCPADLNSIQQFAPSLISDDATTTAQNQVWVAVYRSNNNQPSVLVRDEFLQAMRSATDGGGGGGGKNMVDPSISLLSSNSSNSAAAAPVAVGRLLRTTSDGGEDDDKTSPTYLMDSLRCILKKETTDASCDGGSEHTEALSVAIDTLVVHYLKQQQQSTNNKSNKIRFEGCLRAKGTLVAAQLLQDRGFQEVPTLTKDLATHTSSLDGGLARYAARAARSHGVGPEARHGAVEIVSRLGRVDHGADLAAAERARRQQQSDDDDADPWAAMKRLI